MSSLSQAQVIRLDNPKVHPNADNLEIFVINGFTVVSQKERYAGGQLVVYVPPDMVVNTALPEFSFLGENNRIKPIKLRGILSYGLLVPARPEFVEGQAVNDILECSAYVPPAAPREKMKMGGDIAIAPNGSVKYTDVESYRKYAHILSSDITYTYVEKVDGSNARFLFSNNQLHVGSHNQWLKNGDNVFWKRALEYELDKKLQLYPNYQFFGEILNTNKLRYSTNDKLLFFDIYNIESGRYLDYADMEDILLGLDLPIAPLVMQLRGPRSIEELQEVLDEKSFCGCDIIEGLVIKPTQEMWHEEVGRVILKIHSDAYLNI